ncbi:nuclear pore membrane glycoprotein 210-like [Mercenaria mercenaria]|uniref:nuclear pore membrane glycoprotein 210-like n=1 Tax=Mercenaria mercenaria TaxID=6596 RepID=UPI00234F49C9|nr:nuclear pore membrane glycoprotein 210-like [Mercenaria mercenaria]
MAAPIVKIMAAFFNWKMHCFVVSSVLTFVILADGARLSDPKVLLPYHSSVVTNFTLKINLTREESRSPSCYTWRSSRLDVATLQLINSTDNECALTAEISAVSKSSMRKTSIVMVENKVTGEVLKCIVIVDTLHRIEIETTTRLLYLEDSPEEMMVRGYDLEGNVFSSLQGLEFQWSLHSDTTGGHDDIVDANSILRILKFSESHYTTPPHIEKIEERGRQGDIILVEGVRTGSAYVWAKLRDTSYAKVDHSSVRLMVIANLMISPPEAYILKYATVKYKVEQIRQNSVVAIQMPSSQYSLEVVDGTIGTLDAATSVATALELGETEVKLIDKNIKTSDVLGQPSAVLHVVSPSYLGFVVLPDRKWVLETGRVYTVLIEVYDKHSHKLYPSDNVIIDALFPIEYFDVQFSSKNGTYHIVKTLQKGDTDLEGALSTIIKQDGSEYNVSPTLKQTQFVEIFDPIVVQPELLFFPWDPVRQTSHRYQLRATGGSGDYMWSSNDAEVVTVNKYGEISTSARGEAEVTASDRRNQLHKGLAQVHILPPSDMEFRPDRVEVEVGSMLELPLDIRTTLAGKKYSFNDCRNMPLNVTFTDPSVVENVEGFSVLRDGSCRTVKVKALQQGHTKVKAIYNHGNIKLESSITIATYDALVPVDPEVESVITVGASKEVIFSGGPQPWILDSSKYFQRPHNCRKEVSSEESKNTLIQPVQTVGAQKKLHSFIVSCKNYGEQTLTLQVGNEKTAKNENPAVEEASVSFICAEPVEIHLQPLVAYPDDLPPCPVSREPNQQIPVHCQRDLDLGVSVTDKNGRKFDNISSLEFDWSMSDGSLASLADELQTDIKVTPSGRKIIHNYMMLQPTGIPGHLIVTVTVSKYKAAYLRLAQSNVPEYLSPKISKSIDLRLVEEAVVSPDTLSVFNHPSNKVNMDVAKGSGYFHVVEGRAGVVELKYLEKSKQIQIIPTKDGQLTVTVYDLCIASTQPVQVVITVSGVGSVQLHVMDKVEVGKDIPARVEVLDVTGEKLYSSFFPLMGLTLESASDFIILKRDQTGTKDSYSARYTVHGAVVGHTSLKAVTYLPDGRSVSSTAKPVEVFPPLELIPRNITLIIGGLFQVLSRGGPRPQCTVLFSIKNSKIATVSSSGLLDGQSLGTTRVIGQAVGQDPETGETVIYFPGLSIHDEVTVNVVRLVGVRIHAPLTRIQTGTTKPSSLLKEGWWFCIGVCPHLLGMAGVFCTVISWNVSIGVGVTLNTTKKVKYGSARLTAPYGYKGVISVPCHCMFCRLGFAHRGHTTSGGEQVHQDSILTDELQIQVFEELVMVLPKVCDGELLMTPNTEAILKTNRDGGAKMSYSVLGSNPDVVQVVDDVLVSGSNSGQAALHITAQEESGVTQTLVLNVKVWTSSGQLCMVPRGTTLHFTVTYHDDVGEQFYATNIDMKYRCSRYDLVQVSNGLENNTLVMKTAAVGHTILKVWDSNKPWLVDYISIPVGHAIQPAQARVQLGNIVCFSAPLSSERSSTGSWKGSGGVVVDSKLGVASTSSVGAGTISYVVSEDVMTETDLIVQCWGRRFITLATNKEYNMIVYFGQESAVQGSNCNTVVAEENYQPIRIPFSCSLGVNSANQEFAINDYFSVKPVFISKLGKYACQITSTAQDVPQQMSSADMTVVVTVTVFPIKGQEEVRSVPLLVPFLPPFYVHNSEIHVSTLTPLSSVRISTSSKLADQVKVVVSDPSILEALPAESDPQSKSIVIFPVRLIDTVALWEREQLDVWVDPDCQKEFGVIGVYCDSLALLLHFTGGAYRRDVGWRALFGNILNNYQYWFILLIIIIVTALTVLFGYHAVYGPKYKAAANTSGYMGTPQGSPVGPVYTPASPPAYTPYYPAQTPKSPMLWSTGYTPLDGGSPTRRRSPIQRISPS